MAKQLIVEHEQFNGNVGEKMNKELQRLADDITNYNPKIWKDITKDDLITDYNIMREIYESLNVCEAKLIWYLRYGGCPQIIFGLLKNACKNYEAIQTAKDSRAEMTRISLGNSH